MDKNAVLIGTGGLSWPRMERVSDRYGSVGLYDTDSQERPIAQGGHLKVDLIKQLSGTSGVLIAKVLEPRKSTHIGDLFRGFFPSQPEKDEEIVLGTGNIFHQSQDGVDTVGLSPSDGRPTDWLIPENLYRCHEQTVALYFIAL